MMRITLSIFILAGVFFAVAGCSSRKIDLTSADDGRQLNVNLGERIVIALDGNPTTGYTWEPKDLDASLIQQVGSTAYKSSNQGLVGAGGTQTLTFKTLKAGITSLTLVYHRPWETDVDLLQTFTITVNIK
jgi:inhibitor of cysteine peptidase